MIRFSGKGDFEKTTNFLNRALHHDYAKSFDKYAKRGVDALWAYTPRDTGKTALSWDYKITEDKAKHRIVIEWTNSNMVEGVYQFPVALIIQRGHATESGVWVTGVDYINPALGPIFDDIANDAWKEVTRR